MKYEGDFQNDSKHGMGTLYLKNGDKFFGNFSEDVVHGNGTYTTSNGETVTGEWVNNELIT